MSKSIQIREADYLDVPLICKISEETFIDTYGAQNTPENLEAYLTKHFNQAQILSEIQTDGTIFLIVEIDNEAVGYAKLRVNKSEFSDRNALELERIYVKKKFHGQKLGGLLLEQCCEKTKAAGCDLLWLGVWEYNLKALNFYKSKGFEINGTHVFMLGDDEQTDYLMTKELNILKV
ncbi:MULTISPECIES: GNAT family N-acetyltransferase [unclassified Arcicella]|uniref:GNAT family N-acetyltransferase n=1 Tax=unclassified Arcicella TaxID=2644986 RepID=UPI00285AAD93|nr:MULTISPECIES: GNAT family N-acetyltransferase [unclassified Arcicella]MDR6560600.1 ribosomal protein S18 acetylase RimI-like enzyme [Arcicella sp. BE51]MDR6810484.1 ribosomal protein S18 acetylase RimI-like enzyme [Arcicella sp. BE140]MDR6821834.1 ribosomal protein S18 acetylase RimI-like enzyme [Arcicella sp. BE139]